MKKIYVAALATLLPLSAVQAALIDRGGGLVYDSELNVTWLANANVNGAMTWDQAMAWASGFSYYDSVREVTWSDWRLPVTGAVNGVSFQPGTSQIGTLDMGFNISAPGTLYAGSKGSEMAHLFHNSLGEVGYCDVATSTVNTCSGPAIGFDGRVTSSLFQNFQSARYWSSTENANDDEWAYFFHFGYGDQGDLYKGELKYALAVRDGDVGAVPLPAAAWLFGTGLLGLIGVARRKKPQA